MEFKSNLWKALRQSWRARWYSIVHRGWLIVVHGEFSNWDQQAHVGMQIYLTRVLRMIYSTIHGSIKRDGANQLVTTLRSGPRRDLLEGHLPLMADNRATARRCNPKQLAVLTQLRNICTYWSFNEGSLRLTNSLGHWGKELGGDML